MRDFFFHIYELKIILNSFSSLILQLISHFFLLFSSRHLFTSEHNFLLSTTTIAEMKNLFSLFFFWFHKFSLATVLNSTQAWERRKFTLTFFSTIIFIFSLFFRRRLVRLSTTLCSPHEIICSTHFVFYQHTLSPISRKIFAQWFHTVRGLGRALPPLGGRFNLWIFSKKHLSVIITHSTLVRPFDSDSHSWILFLFNSKFLLHSSSPFDTPLFWLKGNQRDFEMFQNSANEKFLTLSNYWKNLKWFFSPEI